VPSVRCRRLTAGSGTSFSLAAFVAAGWNTALVAAQATRGRKYGVSTRNGETGEGFMILPVVSIVVWSAVRHCERKLPSSVTKARNAVPPKDVYHPPQMSREEDR